MQSKSRSRIAAAIFCSLVLVISLLSLNGGRISSAAIFRSPEEEDTFEFTNNEAEDAYDLHVHWSRAVTIKEVKPFKKKEGGGTSRTDFSNGVVKRGGKARVTVSWDGSTDAKVEEWWWTKKNGDRLGEEKKGSPAAGVPATNGSPKASVASANGLQRVTFDTLNGRVVVSLPDDIRAGDTISGTVIAEPEGNTDDQRKANATKLSEVKLIFGSKIPKDKKDLLILVTPAIKDPAGDRQGGAPEQSRFTTQLPETFDYTIGVNAPRTDTQTVTITINSMVWFVNNQSATTATPSTQFTIPDLSQQGRPVEIFGPFDGNAANTTLRFGPPKSTVQDFEKNTENVSGGFGLIRPLAESPRKCVFESPSNVNGPVEMMVKEGDSAQTGTMRNLGVRLNAPKTNLTRGEKTVVTIEVTGLGGIIKDVPLQLDSKGVITMEGGSFQNLRIKPEEVKLDGRYTTKREITGVQAGGFNVTATVIVGPFDICLQDDNNPTRVLFWNTFTGDYIFTNPGPPAPPKPPGGTVQPGGGNQTGGTGQTGGAAGGKPPDDVAPTGTGVSLTGLGKPVMKGCIITLSHNAPDRRVFARLDACSKTGDASVQTQAPKTTFNIIDKNTTDNSTASPPPK